MTTPINGVYYWIQNLDYGTFLDITNRSASGRRAQFVARPKKEGIKTQQWVFKRVTGSGRSVANRIQYDKQWALNIDQPKKISGANDPAVPPQFAAPSVTAYRTDNRSPSRLTIEQVSNTDVIKITDDNCILQCKDGFTLSWAKDVDDEDAVVPDNQKWRLIIVCPLFAQPLTKYRLRALNGRILTAAPDGTLSAKILSEAKNLKDLWLIEPTDDGKCTIRIADTNDEFLSAKTQQVSGQSIWVVNKGKSYSWDIENIGGFAYQMVRAGDNESDIPLAVTVHNDEEIILKANKLGHGQIWLVERCYS